ncbi:hypothetical protein MKW98_027265 [Papaver atlanticum]|uniref:Uncharacterized protein n=1 Tax=Papaver atlanticum TaxID=357466 RepID=A0AAD4SS04_9MAGN|nr:hypothetical protein MKW98_027265 [Papaver atlanticum]
MRGGYREDGQTELYMNHKRKENRKGLDFLQLLQLRFAGKEWCMLDEIVASVGFQFEFKNGVWTRLIGVFYNDFHWNFKTASLIQSHSDLLVYSAEIVLVNSWCLLLLLAAAPSTPVFGTWFSTIFYGSALPGMDILEVCARAKLNLTEREHGGCAGYGNECLRCALIRYSVVDLKKDQYQKVNTKFLLRSLIITGHPEHRCRISGSSCLQRWIRGFRAVKFPCQDVFICSLWPFPPPETQQGFIKMEAADEYKPANEFQEDSKDPLLEVPLSDSTELWLIQWPGNKQDPDFDGQQVSIKLHHDGQLATFETLSGRISYEMVSYASQEPEATVFLSSASESKFAGKISRRVSLVRYPELSELEEKAKSERLAQQSARTLSTASTPCKSSGGKRGTLPSFSGISRGALVDPSLGSARRGKLSDGGEPSSKHPMKRRVNEPTRTIPHAVNFSGGHGSSVTMTSSGSAESSRSENSKKKKKKAKEEK